MRESFRTREVGIKWIQLELSISQLLYPTQIMGFLGYVSKFILQDYFHGFLVPRFSPSVGLNFSTLDP